MEVSVDQMMWGLYRANKDAFLTENVNSLLSDVILNIPAKSFVEEFSELESNRLVNKTTVTPEIENSAKLTRVHLQILTIDNRLLLNSLKMLVLTQLQFFLILIVMLITKFWQLLRR